MQNFLRLQPSKSAREIARHLGVTRREVNSILYREVNVFASAGTDPPVWHLLRPEDLPGNLIPHQKSHKTPNTTIESADLSSVIFHVTYSEDVSHSTPMWKYPNVEKITKAWIKVNIPSKFQHKFERLLKEQFPTNAEVSIGELFESAHNIHRSALFQNLRLLLLLDGYTSLEAIAHDAAENRLRQNADFEYLLSLRHVPEISRFNDDMEILNRRAGGETLDSIAPTYGLTRERIRQRIRGLSVYGITASNIEIRNRIRKINEDRKILVAFKYITEFPGSTSEEIQNSLCCTASEVKQLLDYRLQRYIAPPKRSGSKTMSNTEILAAIRLASTFEYPLSGPGFDELIESQLLECVSRVRILQIFGSWSNACELAGVESNASVRTSYDRTWTETDLWEYLIDFLLSTQSSNASGNYDNWAREKPGDRPSIATLRNYLGQWNEIVGIALLKLRNEPYHSRYRTLLESIVKDF